MGTVGVLVLAYRQGRISQSTAIEEAGAKEPVLGMKVKEELEARAQEK